MNASLHPAECECTRCRGFEAGNLVALRSGATSERQIRPVARAHRRRFLRQTGLRASDLDPIGRAHLELCVRSTAKLALIDAYIDEHGLIREDGSLQPCVRIYPTLLNSARSSLRALSEHLRRADPEFDFTAALNALGGGQ